MTPQEVNISFEQKGEDMVMKTANMEVTLDTKTGQVEYRNLKGETLLAEKPFGTNFLPRKDVNKDSYTISQSFCCSPMRLSMDWGSVRLGQ